MTNKKSRALSIAVLTIFSIVVVLGCVFAFVSLDDGQLGIRNYVAYPKLIKLGLDLSGGAYAEYTAEQPEDMTDEEFNAAIEGTRRSLEDLLFGKGYTEAQVSSYGNTIRVEVPDIDDPERIFDLVGRPSSLEFKEYTSEDTVNETLMTGEEIANAGVVYNDGAYLVALEFTSEGAEKFADITADLVGKQLGIYVNGELLMAPNVNETISGGTCTIEGDFTYDEAYDLAVQIQAGSFPLDLKMTNSNTISATLGDSALKAGIIAGLVGLALIVVYMCAFYGLMGVSASMALIYYACTYVFFLAVFPWVQLTLAGIAGVLLSIGMAVDANVIIFERIKEEYGSGRNMINATTIGFKRSLGAIIDGNVTTIIGAIVLMIVGTSTIRGFGITLLIGIVLSLFSSLVVTRVLLKSIMSFHDERHAKFYMLRRREADDIGFDTIENAEAVDEARRAEEADAIPLPVGPDADVVLELQEEAVENGATITAEPAPAKQKQQPNNPRRKYKSRRTKGGTR